MSHNLAERLIVNDWGVRVKRENHLASGRFGTNHGALGQIVTPYSAMRFIKWGPSPSGRTTTLVVFSLLVLAIDAGARKLQQR